MSMPGYIKIIFISTKTIRIILSSTSEQKPRTKNKKSMFTSSQFEALTNRNNTSDSVETTMQQDLAIISAIAESLEAAPPSSGSSYGRGLGFEGGSG